ncbi:hypothetical protein Tco_0712748 [Tanacetum coccineum]
MSIQDMEDLKQQYLDEMKKRASVFREVVNLSTYPSQHFNSFCYDDDDDEEATIQVREYYKNSPVAITPDFSIMDSLIMEDEHLDTIPEMDSDELIKSSVKNLVTILSESEDFSDIESEYDVPVCDDFMTSSNPLFDFNDDSTSSDDESLSDENIDSLLKEFSGELAHIDLIPPGINETDFDPEEEICLVERLLYDNKCNPLDPDSLMEEIDLFLTSDNSKPPGIENDDYDSEGDILFLEEFLSNDSPSLPENESFRFDIPSSPCPPAKPPDDGIYFEPITGILTTKVVGDISEHYVLMPKLLPTQPTLCPVIDTLIPFSSENEDKVHLLSH